MPIDYQYLNNNPGLQVAADQSIEDKLKGYYLLPYDLEDVYVYSTSLEFPVSYEDVLDGYDYELIGRVARLWSIKHYTDDVVIIASKDNLNKLLKAYNPFKVCRNLLRP